MRSRGRGDKLRETTDAFDNVTHAAEGEMEDVTKSVFQFGDNLQKSMVDVMFGMIPFMNGGQNNPEALMTGMFRQSADAMRKGIDLVQKSAGSIGNVVQNATTQNSAQASSGWGPVPNGNGNGNTQHQSPPQTAPNTPTREAGWGPMPSQSSDPNKKK